MPWTEIKPQKKKKKTFVQTCFTDNTPRKKAILKSRSHDNDAASGTAVICTEVVKVFSVHFES